jgi:hypothetical protein
MSVSSGTDAPAFASFTYGAVVPAPSSLVLMGSALGSALAIAGVRRFRTRRTAAPGAFSYPA